VISKYGKNFIDLYEKHLVDWNRLHIFVKQIR
jgi:hypothetical protein